MSGLEWWMDPLVRELLWLLCLGFVLPLGAPQGENRREGGRS